MTDTPLLSRRRLLAGAAGTAIAAAVPPPGPAAAASSADSEILDLWRRRCHLEECANAAADRVHAIRASLPPSVFDPVVVRLEAEGRSVDIPVKTARELTVLTDAFPESVAALRVDLLAQFEAGAAPKLAAQRESGFAEASAEYDRLSAGADDLAGQLCDARAHTAAGLAAQARLLAELLENIDFGPKNKGHNLALAVAEGLERLSRPRTADGPTNGVRQQG